MEKKNVLKIVLAGGGTGGHIYPGIAVADEIRLYANANGFDVELYWIGSKTGMDRTIVEKNLLADGGSINKFYGISCGKLRRYFSLKNFFDVFKIVAGFFGSIHVLRKIKPDFLFSKGGFVSVPPCFAAKMLKIPYFTHECDFTPGLATRLNSKNASKILLSYEETANRFSPELRNKCVVTGNPVRPVFYSDCSEIGFKFLNLGREHEKPILLVCGGSLGARQINELVWNNIDSLSENYIVVHQTGAAWAEEHPERMTSNNSDYMPFAFIYSEMSGVLQCADVVLSRAGANSLWEGAVCSKPMILVPLCGNGTRGDQVDNAEFFESKSMAVCLTGDKANDANLLEAANRFISSESREIFADSCRKFTGAERPAYKIAKLVIESAGGKI